MERFGFKKILNPLCAALAAQTGLFDTTERGHIAGHNPNIQPDKPGFQRLAYTPGAGVVACVEIRGQPVGCIIGQSDGLLLGVKPKQQCDGAKGFFAGKAHLRGCMFQDHGGDIGGAFRRDGPSPDDLRPFGQGIQICVIKNNEGGIPSQFQR